ncbi:MAG: hypothetical protein R2737_00420 [Candidatus Nanopelagicales bacterium]
MTGLDPTALLAGILFPAEWLTSEWFAVWASFVALNTLLYVTLAVAKMLPKVHPADLWFRLRGGRNRRRETRSIYPDAPV